MTNWICDVCRQSIDDTDSGIVKFRKCDWRKSHPQTFYDVVLCHKGLCDDRNDGRDRWIELSWVLGDAAYRFLERPLLAGKREEIQRKAAQRVHREREVASKAALARDAVLTPEDV